VKPGFEQPIDTSVYNKTVSFFEQLMQLLHPFMPFFRRNLSPNEKRNEGDNLCIRQQTEIGKINSDILNQGAFLKTISTIRDARNKNNISPKEPIRITIESRHVDYKNYSCYQQQAKNT
jgi:valyl-tRNA synthetase